MRSFSPEGYKANLLSGAQKARIKTTAKHNHGILCSHITQRISLPARCLLLVWYNPGQVLIYELIGRFKLRAQNRLTVVFGPVEDLPAPMSEVEKMDYLESLKDRAVFFPAISDCFAVFYALEALLQRGYR